VDGGVQAPEVLVLQEVTWRVAQSADGRNRKCARVEPLEASSGWTGWRSACRIARNGSGLIGIANQIGPFIAG
jgi:hypothetical protein